MAVSSIDHTQTGIVRFRLEPNQSRLAVQAFAEGLLSVFGHDPIMEFREFTGYAQFNPETLGDASVEVNVSAESLTVVNATKEKDRLEIEHTAREDVLEVAKYPEISFVSSDVTLSPTSGGRYRARIIGDLSLHGITQHNFPVHSEISLTEGGFRAHSELSLKQSEFQIKRISVAGGTLKVKNEVKVSFDVVGINL